MQKVKEFFADISIDVNFQYYLGLTIKEYLSKQIPESKKFRVEVLSNYELEIFNFSKKFIPLREKVTYFRERFMNSEDKIKDSQEVLTESIRQIIVEITKLVEALEKEKF